MFGTAPQANASPLRDPYRGTQHDLVLRGSGFLSIFGAVAALTLTAFYPPTAELGAAGWALVAPSAIASIALGFLSVSLKHRPSDAAIAASSFIGVAQIALLQWLVGGGKAPFIQLLLLPTLGAAVSQPLRRCVMVLLAAAAAAASPLLYSTIDAPTTATELCTLSVMTLMTAIVVASTRSHRARLLDASDFANELAHIDPLTGMPNRRAFDQMLAHGIESASVTGTPMSLLLCDVNSFKHVNDTYGHQAGDQVLQAIARELSDAVRGPDAAFRWAGDEFAVILRETDGVRASRMAARLRESVRLNWAHGSVITIGTGVAELRPEMTAEELLAEADRALLDQKAHRSWVREAAVSA
jgi:diguanylate cyclase (GGDEF)-like protein